MSDDQKIDPGAILREMARIGLGQGGDTTLSFLNVALACEAVLDENERLLDALRGYEANDRGYSLSEQVGDLDDAAIEGPIMGPLIILEERLKQRGAPEWMHKVAKRAQSIVEDQGDEIERLRAELERERAFKESYYGQLQEIFAKYKQWPDTPDGYVGDAPYWKGPSKMRQQNE